MSRHLPMQSDASLAVSASTACVAGAAHGLFGSPWPAFVMASGSALALLSTGKAENTAAARSVLDTIAAVAIYRAVRTSCRAAAAAPNKPQALPPRPPEMPWSQRARSSAPRPQMTIPNAPVDLADRVLTPEHQEALERFGRRDVNPSSARRSARRLLADIALEAASTTDLARVGALRTWLADARASLRLVRLTEEATAFVSWNNASPSAREHRLCCGAGPSECPAWSEDERQIDEVAALVDAAEQRALDAAGGTQ